MVSVDGKNFEASRQAAAMISNFSLQRRWRAPVAGAMKARQRRKQTRRLKRPLRHKNAQHPTQDE